MSSPRLFLGVDLPPPAKEVCHRFSRELKKTGADVKWVEEENFHVTLKFLGDVTEDRIQEVADSCGALTAKQCGFSFSLSGLGAFPSASAPRILWIGIEASEKPFERLAQGLEETLSRIGFRKEERAFHPHVTIGRVRSSHNRVPLIEALHEHRNGISVPDLTARAVTLFASTLTPQGAVYTALATLPLAA